MRRTRLCAASIFAVVAGCAQGDPLSDSLNGAVGQSGFGGAIGAGGAAGMAPLSTGGYPTSGMGGALTGAGGIIAGTGGFTLGTGGQFPGTGGFVLGSGGETGSGGSLTETGGTSAGSGGILEGTGGSVQGSGGAIQGSGGADHGTGGAQQGTGGVQGSGGDGAGGTPGTGGTPDTGGMSGTGGTSTGGPTQLPTATNCPTFTNGGVVQFSRASGTNVPVTIFIDPNAKNKPEPGGPLVVYWHATLSSPLEVHQGFGDANIQKVTSMGGVVAAPATTACPGCITTDDGYWFVEDDLVMDKIVACAIQQAKIDTRHIHTLGWSAGGLHTCHVGVVRSNYMASIISYSGGYAPWPGTMTPQDPSNHVASILTYGTADAVVVDFPTQSKQWYSTFQPQGYYTMMCKHQGGHMIDGLIAPLSLKFFMDHPYKVSPEPYASKVPSDYPNNALGTQCANTPL